MKSGNVIFDLDGTLGCDWHRRSLIAEEGWGAYFEAAEHDIPIFGIQVLFQQFADLNYRVFIITNRSSKYEEQTMVWLTEHDLVPSILSMRREEDYIDGKLFKGNHGDDKLERAQILGLNPDNVLMVFEDMNEVVLSWRAAGYECLQVREQGTLYKPKTV